MSLNEYLQRQPEEMPHWLDQFEDGAPFSRQQFFGSRVVYCVLPVSLHEIPPPSRYRGASVHAHPEVLPCPHPSPPIPPS